MNLALINGSCFVNLAMVMDGSALRRFALVMGKC